MPKRHCRYFTMLQVHCFAVCLLGADWVSQPALQVGGCPALPVQLCALERLQAKARRD